MAAAAKKLFLIAAMAHLSRAFYTPMNRMSAPSGIPTKVPFLFNDILRLVKDLFRKSADTNAVCVTKLRCWKLSNVQSFTDLFVIRSDEDGSLSDGYCDAV